MWRGPLVRHRIMKATDVLLQSSANALSAVLSVQASEL
jgi:hypothetical protein